MPFVKTSIKRRKARAPKRKVAVLGDVSDAYAEILSPRALEFVARLHRAFDGRRRALLQRRVEMQDRIDRGMFPSFLEETQHIRQSDWAVASIPADLQDRRVEITGPVERKMVINALNSGANVFMADFEDSNSPTWANVLDGQINLRDAVNKTITFTRDDGKVYKLNDDTATLFVRPRGWHLEEKHVLVDGQPVSGALFDFGLFFFHNAATLLEQGTGAYFYLPKLENHLEARLWNDVFNYAQDSLDVRRGSIRATVLIENILAAFEMDEILWELKDHSAGLNCGRWDYIFSFIKTFRSRPEFVLPNRSKVAMERPFLKSYTELLIQTCHRRKAHAMGGMAAQIPIKNDSTANRLAIKKVRKDKLREVRAGHDGTWVAHPGLVPIARDIFDEHMSEPNQIDRTRDDVSVKAGDLLEVPAGSITREGLKQNVSIGIQYLEAWLGGNGCVPINHLMEDAATAEISRSQVWQWIHHAACLDDETSVTAALVSELISEIDLSGGNGSDPEAPANATRVLATQLFEEMMTGSEFPDWLTTVAYKHID